MDTFEPGSTSFLADPTKADGLPIIQVAIADVEPLRRRLSHGVFNDRGESGSARVRVVSILRGFRQEDAFPPIQVSRLSGPTAYRFKLKDGAHRFYCAIAAGFTEVPAVEVEDWSEV